MMGAYDLNMFKAEGAFQRMQDNNIRGAKLYYLWNDCCDKNTDKTLNIMLEKPIEDIVKHINFEGGSGIKYD